MAAKHRIDALFYGFSYNSPRPDTGVRIVAVLLC